MNPQQKPLAIAIGILFLGGLLYITYANRPVIDLKDVPQTLPSMSTKTDPVDFRMTGTIINMGPHIFTEMGCGFSENPKLGDRIPCNKGSVQLGMAPLTKPAPNETIRLEDYTCPAQEILIFKGAAEYEITGPCKDGVEIGAVYTVEGTLSTDKNTTSSLTVRSLTKSTESTNKNVVSEVTIPNPVTPSDSVINPAPNTYTLADIATHADTTSCWTAVNGSVYELTEWANRHPGGSKPILFMCGKDATENFQKKHGASKTAQAALGLLKIGTLR